MPKEQNKKYFIFQDGSDIMFVCNIPPEELDDAVIRSFKAEVKARGLDRIIEPDIERIVRSAKQGEVVRIGGAYLTERPQEPEEEEEEEEEPEPEIDLENLPFEIEVSQDRMQGKLEMTDPSIEITPKHIEVCLEHTGIKYGLIEKNIEKLLEDWPKIFRVLIAEGTLPEDGEDAELELVKDFKDNLAPEVTEEGYVDFKHLNLISPIEAGEVLQERVPPTEGVPGSDIFGKLIPPKPGKDKKLQKGQNTETNEDGTKLLSSEEGFLHRRPDGSIDVRPVYTVSEDVDYSTGNINYKGDVLVKGDVRAGFSVTAGGDVRIYGAVEDALVEAEGHVIINGGVLSSGKARIKAGGDVSVGFIQHATVEADGCVLIRIEAIGSSIVAGKDVEVMRRNGRIVGGEVMVGGWVVSPTFGTENGPVLRVKFIGLQGVVEPDLRYEHCFASTRKLESPLEIRFGSTRTRLGENDATTTVSVKDGNIVIGNFFVGGEELKVRRRARDGK